MKTGKEFDFTQVKVVSNRAIPAGRGRRDGTLSNLLRNMKVGDSFDIPIHKRNVVVSVAHANSIPVRSITTDPVKGIVTVWRIEAKPAIGSQINAVNTEKPSKSKRGKRLSPVTLPAAAA